jgi:hypothetical protein
MALPTRLVTTWRRRCGIGEHLRGQRAVEAHAQPDALLVGLHRHDARHVQHHLVHLAGDALDLQAPGLDLARGPRMSLMSSEQVLAAAVDDVQVLLRVGRALRAGAPQQRR